MTRSRAPSSDAWAGTVNVRNAALATRVSMSRGASRLIGCWQCLVDANDRTCFSSNSMAANGWTDAVANISTIEKLRMCDSTL